MTYTAQTRVFLLNARHPDRGVLTEAARVLRHGGLVAFPTETVYGLGANALDADAVSRIFAAKGRPTSDPIIVHIGALARIDQVARDIGPLAARLSERFWPGPLTLVLKRNERVPDIVSAGSETVGVRMPSHPVALALLRASGLPIAAPSANLFARPSPTTAQHVLDDLDGRVDIVLDAGPTEVGVESTVVDLTQETPRLLRPGGIPLEALRELIPDLEVVTQYLADNEIAAGPGMLLKHYSPRAAVYLFAGDADRALDAMQKRAADLSAEGTRVGILAADEDLARFERQGLETVALGSLADLEAIARHLFAGLRELDSRGADVILVRALPKQGLGLAIWDRLVRAAEGHVVDVG